ncbi:MAG: 4-hydroxy-tetrahydrodipicolinate reductase [Planctomycetes bacterium]|nr:4-hydroxy-tetrahydrodipicolinate reductase [Planctomycetota bacterium]
MTALRVAVLGARGRLGTFACELVRRSPGFELVAEWDRGSDWRALARASGAVVALEATHAGLGAAHAHELLERGLRIVVGTSGVTVEESAALDRRARELGLGGLVVPNFSVGSWLLQRFAAEAAPWFAGAEIVEGHHERKLDAPSGTAAETARRMSAERARAGSDAFAPPTSHHAARGEVQHGVPIHSVRLPGLYAHQDVLLGGGGEVLRLSHDMHGPEAFGPGILAALRHAARAQGVARGLGPALERA